MSLYVRSSRPRVLAGTTLTVAALAAFATAFAPQASAQVTSLDCRGTERSCRAVVSLAGGASNELLRVALPGTNMRLISHTVRPHWIRGAYSLGRGRYSLGGSLYSARLNAVQAIPRGARLTLLFEAPVRSLACRSVTRNVSYISISRLPGRQARGAFSCQQAHAVTQTWALRFRAGLSVRSFRVNGIRYRCTVVPRVPQNQRCNGGGTRLRFAGPTG
jgi:hypothetical protein